MATKQATMRNIEAKLQVTNQWNKNLGISFLHIAAMKCTNKG